MDRTVKNHLGYGSDELPLDQRFFAKVDVGNSPAGCWIWTAHVDDDGYGRLQVQRRSVRAYRIAYEMFVGPVPVGLQIDHLCREPGCVNPLHLEAVTREENLKRGRRAGGHGRETHCPQGHPYDDANTRRRPDGCRRCRTCERQRQRRRKAST